MSHLDLKIKKRGKAIVRYCSDRTSNYDARFCEALVEYMSEGRSFASFAGVIGVGQSTLSAWTKKHPEFKRAKELAVLASLGKWEDIALMQATGQIKGNASALIFTLKNRFSDYYKDKHEVEHGGDLTFIAHTGITRDIKEVEAVVVEEDTDLL